MSRKNTIHDDLDQKAAEWVIRLGTGRPDKKTQRALHHWLQQSEAHRQAFAEAQRLWRSMDQLRKNPGPLTQYQLSQSNLLRSTAQKKYPWLGIAAGVLSVFLLFQLWFGVSWQAITADYATAPGEQQLIRLPDGSEIQLGPDSAVNVQYSQRQRRVHLLKGAAYFTVAPDTQAIFRPFIADAEIFEAKALGTQFVIDRLDDQRIKLGVTEHSVSATLALDHTSMQVPQGYMLHVAPDGPSALTPFDASRLAAWRRNSLVFDRTPLSEALAQINRFRSNKIIIGRASLEAIEISGVFDAGNTDQILSAIAYEFNLDYYSLPPFLTVLR